jgi:hypothetical protein
MSTRNKDDNRNAEAEETPKGFYRKDTPYDPFAPVAAPDQEPEEGEHRHRRKKSRKNWRSIRPRPAPGESDKMDTSLWIAAGSLMLGFVIGFAVRPVLMPWRSNQAVIPAEALALPTAPNSDLKEKTKITREAINNMNKEVQDKALHDSSTPYPMQRLEVKPLQPRLREDEGLLKLQPAPPPLN